MNVITHTFVRLKCLTETKIQILYDHVDHTRFHIVEMGCQMVQLLSAHIVGPTMCVNLTCHKSHLFHHMINGVKTCRWQGTLIGGVLVFISETCRSCHPH